MSEELTYRGEMIKAMTFLSNEPRVVFLGQAVAVAGTVMRSTLELIDQDRLIEMPVEEDFQLGVSIGLATCGSIPVSIFPRLNFLMLAMNQLVNHLDKLQLLLEPSVAPKVIVRTSIGSVDPLDPGPQHKGDMTEPLRLLCPHMNVVRLDDAKSIVPAYEEALLREDGVSSILIEWGDLYGN